MAEVSQDHYRVLGVSRRATSEEIRAAYRTLAKTHHPDAGGVKGSERAFSQVARAYEVLSDPKARRAYETELEQRELDAAGRPGTSHYSWENIASRRGGHPGESGRVGRREGTDFDALYDTFFSSMPKPQA